MSPSTSAPASRIVFIIHGRHCPDGLPASLLQPFREQFSVEVLLTTAASGATRLAREAALSGARWVIAVGGDGTVHEVINGVMSVPAAQRQQLVVGVLPSGTGNDFVRTLGSDHRDGLLALIAAGHAYPLDLIRVTSRDSDGQPQVRWCNNIASLGISSDIVRRVKRLPAWLPPSAAFCSAVLAALLRFRPRPMRLTLDGASISGSFLCLSVANGRYFGSGLGIAPQARLDDGLFELVLIRDGNGLDFLRLLPRLRAAQALHDPRVSYLRGRHLQVDGAAADCPLELDGELCGSAPVEFELVPAALRCLMPPPD